MRSLGMDPQLCRPGTRVVHVCDCEWVPEYWSRRSQKDLTWENMTAPIALGSAILQFRSVFGLGMLYKSGQFCVGYVYPDFDSKTGRDLCSSTSNKSLVWVEPICVAIHQSCSLGCSQRKFVWLIPKWSCLEFHWSLSWGLYCTVFVLYFKLEAVERPTGASWDPIKMGLEG